MQRLSQNQRLAQKTTQSLALNVSSGWMASKYWPVIGCFILITSGSLVLRNPIAPMELGKAKYIFRKIRKLLNWCLGLKHLCGVFPFWVSPASPFLTLHSITFRKKCLNILALWAQRVVYNVDILCDPPLCLLGFLFLFPCYNYTDNVQGCNRVVRNIKFFPN